MKIKAIAQGLATAVDGDGHERFRLAGPGWRAAPIGADGEPVWAASFDVSALFHRHASGSLLAEAARRVGCVPVDPASEPDRYRLHMAATLREVCRMAAAE